MNISSSRIILPCALICALSATTNTAQSALVLTYDVNIVQDGPVLVGSTVDWELTATVSGTPDPGEGNFGIAVLSVDLEDSFGETLNTGTIAGPFAAAFEFDSGGTWDAVAMQLELIGGTDLMQDGSTVGVGTLGSFLLATGSYTVTQVGTHTLQAVDSGSSNRYFTASGQAANDAALYSGPNFGSDTVQVVPEPASLAMMGLAACGALGLRRRRRGSQVEQVA